MTWAPASFHVSGLPGGQGRGLGAAGGSRWPAPAAAHAAGAEPNPVEEGHALESCGRVPDGSFLQWCL